MLYCDTKILMISDDTHCEKNCTLLLTKTVIIIKGFLKQKTIFYIIYLSPDRANPVHFTLLQLLPLLLLLPGGGRGVLLCFGIKLERSPIYFCFLDPIL